MKNRKAAGADNIPAEVLKADILLPLFQDIWQREKFPEEWKEGFIIKIPKRGDLGQCRKWRGVTLLAVISKIFNKMILERIKNSLEMGLRNEQVGLRHNRSCIDQLNTLRVIIQGVSNMTGTDLCVRLYKSVPIIFEPPCRTIRRISVTPLYAVC